VLAVPDTWLRARRNVLGVADYLNEYPGPDDLRLFVNEYRSDGTSATWQISGGDEPGGPSNLGPEASLNIQYTEAMAYPTHILQHRGSLY